MSDYEYITDGEFIEILKHDWSPALYEKVVRAWLNDRNLTPIDWEVMNKVANCDVGLELVRYDAEKCMYVPWGDRPHSEGWNERQKLKQEIRSALEVIANAERETLSEMFKAAAVTKGESDESKE